MGRRGQGTVRGGCQPSGSSLSPCNPNHHYGGPSAESVRGQRLEAGVEQLNVHPWSPPLPAAVRTRGGRLGTSRPAGGELLCHRTRDKAGWICRPLPTAWLNICSWSLLGSHLCLLEEVTLAEREQYFSTLLISFTSASARSIWLH